MSHVMSRVVMRFPPRDLERLNRLTERATTAAGRRIARASIVRALLARALRIAESDPGFVANLGEAVVKRGRKPAGAAP